MDKPGIDGLLAELASAEKEQASRVRDQDRARAAVIEATQRKVEAERAIQVWLNERKQEVAG